MKLYGVVGNINDWLCDFLTNRKMKVVVDGEESDSVTVKVGRSKPVAVLTSGYIRPGQYSRSGQYWLIGGQLKN